jgi:hypothetical protein
MKKMYKVKIYIIISLGAIVLLSVFIYARLTYIDNVVKEGSAYGFFISDSKESSCYRAKKVFDGEKVFIIHPVDNNGFGPHMVFNSIEDSCDLLNKRSIWRFYFDEGFYDFLELNFLDDKLFEIYRHRKKFELP